MRITDLKHLFVMIIIKIFHDIPLINTIGLIYNHKYNYNRHFFLGWNYLGGNIQLLVVLDLGNILVVHYVAISLEMLRLILAGHLYKRICYLQYMVSFKGQNQRYTTILKVGILFQNFALICMFSINSNFWQYFCIWWDRI